LAELFVFGRRAGLAAARFALSHPPGLPEDEAVLMAKEREGLLNCEGSVIREGENNHLAAGRALVLLRLELQQLMWEKAGIIRDGTGLEKALARLGELEAQAREKEAGAGRLWREALELRFMLTVARAVLLSALARQESRGAHYRRDYPSPDEQNWRRRTLLKQENGEMRLRLLEVG
jgi:succinate dehydrogenase/fumarate reductase flavoprotein subunit